MLSSEQNQKNTISTPSFSKEGKSNDIEVNVFLPMEKKGYNPFNTVGLFTYLRTYARRHNDDDPESTIESWEECITRRGVCYTPEDDGHIGGECRSGVPFVSKITFKNNKDL